MSRYLFSASSFSLSLSFFFFNDTATTEIYTLSLHDALPILCSFISPFRAERSMVRELVEQEEFIEVFVDTPIEQCIARDPKGLYRRALDRKSTRLNSSHPSISYAVFCLKKKKESSNNIHKKT